MKKMLKEILMVLGFTGVCLLVMFAIITKEQTTLEKLEDKVAYKNMLLKNAQGGVVSHSDELVYVTEQIKELRQQLAEENQKKRG